MSGTADLNETKEFDSIMDDGLYEIYIGDMIITKEYGPLEDVIDYLETNFKECTIDANLFIKHKDKTIYHTKTRDVKLSKK